MLEPHLVDDQHLVIGVGVLFPLEQRFISNLDNLKCFSVGAVKLILTAKGNVATSVFGVYL